MCCLCVSKGKGLLGLSVIEKPWIASTCRCLLKWKPECKLVWCKLVGCFANSGRRYNDNCKDVWRKAHASYFIESLSRRRILTKPCCLHTGKFRKCSWSSQEAKASGWTWASFPIIHTTPVLRLHTTWLKHLQKVQYCAQCLPVCGNLSWASHSRGAQTQCFLPLLKQPAHNTPERQWKRVCMGFGSICKVSHVSQPQSIIILKLWILALAFLGLGCCITSYLSKPANGDLEQSWLWMTLYPSEFWLYQQFVHLHGQDS